MTSESKSWYHNYVVKTGPIAKFSGNVVSWALILYNINRCYKRKVSMGNVVWNN